MPLALAPILLEASNFEKIEKFSLFFRNYLPLTVTRKGDGWT